MRKPALTAYVAARGEGPGVNGRKAMVVEDLKKWVRRDITARMVDEPEVQAMVEVLKLKMIEN